MIFRIVLFSGEPEFRENPPSDDHTLLKHTNDSFPVFSVFRDRFGRNSVLVVSVQGYQEDESFAEFGRMKTIVYLKA
jgi:hypothetical protein